jgi:ACS family D-galactonate transporter-like MFS transporter
MGRLTLNALLSFAQCKKDRARFGMLLGLAVFGATFTTDPVWVIFWISITLSGLAVAATAGWSIPSSIAPRSGTATIGGITNLLNNMMGVVVLINDGLHRRG